jgi:hypothetical protein
MGLLFSNFRNFTKAIFPSAFTTQLGMDSGKISRGCASPGLSAATAADFGVGPEMSYRGDKSSDEFRREFAPGRDRHNHALTRY